VYGTLPSPYLPNGEQSRHSPVLGFATFFMQLMHSALSALSTLVIPVPFPMSPTCACYRTCAAGTCVLPRPCTVP